MIYVLFPLGFKRSEGNMKMKLTMRNCSLATVLSTLLLSGCGGGDGAGNPAASNISPDGTAIFIDN